MYKRSTEKNELTAELDLIYEQYNKREYVHPDPLEFLYDYPDARDREIAGLIAASLAYGRVGGILKSVGTILSEMSPTPYEFLMSGWVPPTGMIFRDFKHRFTTGAEISSLLTSIRKLLKKHGSLNACFLKHYDSSHKTILPALRGFTRDLGCQGGSLVPDPSKNSACKRLNLYLRWMIRKDSVDPGGWKGIPASALIVPLDIHMARIAKILGITNRKSPNIAMAEEITAAFRNIRPDDPVRYDFSLTRFGIHPDMSYKMFSDRKQKG